MLLTSSAVSLNCAYTAPSPGWQVSGYSRVSLATMVVDNDLNKAILPARAVSFNVVFVVFLQWHYFIHIEWSSFVRSIPVTPQYLVKERCRLSYMYDAHTLCISSTYKKIIRYVSDISSQEVTNGFEHTANHRSILESRPSALHAERLTTKLKPVHQANLAVVPFTSKQHGQSSPI